MINKKDITGIILSGGKNSRMGKDKGFLSLNGKLFTQYCIDALTPLVSETIIISNNKDYDRFGLKRIEDVIENAGPLAGLYSGLLHSNTTYNLVLSCDIPLITSNILEKLIDNISDYVDISQIESNGKTMPLIALYKTKNKDLFYKLLKSGERRLRYAVNQCKVKNIKLDSESEKFTINVNTPEELKMIENEYQY
jgi:molybdopterin-guanine dinucleotide biosynthesis protein A